MHSIDITNHYMLVRINRPESKDEFKQMLLALKQYVKEDPHVVIYTLDTLKQTIIMGTGEQHLNEILDRLVHKFDLNIDAQRPEVLYKETFGEAVNSEGSFIRQASSIGRYGRCHLRIEPQARNAGYEFINHIHSEGILPYEYIPSIDDGVQCSMLDYIVSCFPIVDVKVTLFDGSHHPMDSSQMSYKIAASIAFRNGLKQSGFVILEPIVSVTFNGVADDVVILEQCLHSMKWRTERFQRETGLIDVITEISMREWLSAKEEIQSIIGQKYECHVELRYYDAIPEHLKEQIVKESSLRSASHTDLLYWERQSKENEEWYMNEFIDEFWEET
ncbi:hypothetical protein ACFVQB_27645 [Paenibacillus sp. NPDC057886]|uniref:hypothetical protein n=1 Tax=Paenibacillus sp. NPDC057886 TaxID=3346270 RepID=UPI00368F9B2D